jgi:transposase-like protein
MLENKQKKEILGYIRKGIGIPLIAKKLGIPHRTLSRWLKDDPDVKIAQEYYKAWVESLFN